MRLYSTLAIAMTTLSLSIAGTAQPQQPAPANADDK